MNFRIASIRTTALAAACVLIAGAAWAQSAPAAGAPANGKVGVLNVRQAILSTSEGKQASAELQSQFAPRQTELENMNKQIDDLRREVGEELAQIGLEHLDVLAFLADHHAGTRRVDGDAGVLGRALDRHLRDGSIRDSCGTKG